jgi:sugar phosphate isomerase/epimerase
MFKLSIITDEVSRDFNEALEFAVQTGLDGIELRNLGDRNLLDLSDAEVETLAARIRQAGLEVSALSTPLFKCSLEEGPDKIDVEHDPFKATAEDWREHLPLFERAAHLAAVFGTTLVRCFAFYGPQVPIASVKREILSRLSVAAQHAQAVNPRITLCLENEPTTYLRNLEDILELMPLVSTPYKLLWDPGNAFFAGDRSLETAFDAIHSYVAHIHVKDPKVNGGGISFVPLGEGMIPYQRHLRQWQVGGYRGYITLEPHLVIGESSLWGSKQSIEHLRHLMVGLGGR